MILLLLVAHSVAGLQMAPPTATVEQGKIQGTTGINLDGDEFLKFLGIPFAKPPVGNLRFKAPEAPDSWQGVRDCTRDGNTCISVYGDPLKSSEDCLYLNVFTKLLPGPETTPKPVMVFLHPGGFVLGSGTQDMCAPDFLMTEDIVLVTLNYRLGIFGFLSFDDPALGVPGNAGLKDQTMALKWVQKNIAGFNGDPHQVTIFGNSAGGASVQFQILSPTAKGLFHRAIAQSGSALNPWAWGDKNGLAAAEKLGSQVASDTEALQLLMEASTEQVLNASRQFTDNLLDSSQRRPFGPVIELPTPTAFLTRDPVDLWEAGEFNDVPLMLGDVSNEGIIYEFEKLLSGKEPSIDPVEAAVSWKFGLDKGSDKFRSVKELVRNFYYKDGVSKKSLFEVLSDVLFIEGVLESARLHLRKTKHPVHLYVFSYNSSSNRKFLTAMGLDDTIQGNPHGSECSFLFSKRLLGIDLELTEDDFKAVRETVKIWANFARTGQPHPLWDPVTISNNLTYFYIDRMPLLKQNPFEDRMKLWQHIKLLLSEQAC
ncbi:juvenile hormone esterase isoform X1 [Dendroctonus ponderosae]|uniref:juvenile hormone esterase isoform X1 n=1 Tax=Dendroctonus ponderosae TaxID=77166 RepID=UPI002035D3DC|nr:juvenile hormone esterase isoform X1 [Dendroctonus ponderosae]